MSLRMLVDEDTQAKHLIHLLRRDGHDILTVSEAGLEGAPDRRVLEHARDEKRMILTRNCDEFFVLHSEEPVHPGICAIYQDRDPAKNMSYAEICRALVNLESSGLELAGQYVALNAWNF